jgi:hypothetical protein
MTALPGNASSRYFSTEIATGPHGNSRREVPFLADLKLDLTTP